MKDSVLNKNDINLKVDHFELVPSKELFQLLIQNSNDSICLIDSEGNQVFLNKAAEKTTGFSINELLGPFSKVIIPEDLPKVMEAWNEVIQKKNKVVKVQYRHIHKTKDFIWMEAAGQNHLDNPALNAVVVNVRDITFQKETEELLKATNKELRKVNKLKDKLIKSELMNSEYLNELLFKRKTELTTNTLMLKQLITFHDKILKELKAINRNTDRETNKKLTQLISEISSSLKLINWNDFQNRFEELNKDYLNKFHDKFPSLSPSDYKLMMYLKMGFSSKEISAITQNTIETVEVSRSRLRKKLGLPASENLSLFIQKI